SPSDPPPEAWYTTNRVGIPAFVLGSAEFNTGRRRVRLHGTRETHRGLFSLLDPCANQEEAAEVFDHYLHLVARGGRGRGGGILTTLDLLRGWGMDSSSVHGAVLKGWVESRFGLVPTFHKEALGAFPSDAWATYLHEKNAPAYQACGINFQIDLLYEYCQWSLWRFPPNRLRRLTLWRGSNDCEQQVLEGDLRDPWCVLRLNNLVSFTSSRERADEFGDWVLEAEIPTCKLLYFPGLIREPVFNSEREYLVIGGAYRIDARRSEYF
ncbi:NAD(+)--dinitrogen-reductase ADP-D-ribosyltransferase, partial [Pararhodospirillum oryzae]|uniref:NAD(+)--dinitrogen-reductase ADP-D-ribosyltransferase n=1 Tax=Pararhodospirillum oryzae TaxID=478448 RepID=UPI0011BDE737